MIMTILKNLNAASLVVRRRIALPDTNRLMEDGGVFMKDVMEQEHGCRHHDHPYEQQPLPHSMGSMGAVHMGGYGGHGSHGDHHKAMLKDFRKRFWISLLLTVPVLILSPLIQDLLGIRGILAFKGDLYVLFVLATLIFLYGGKPFLVGLYKEIKTIKPGMMTLIAMAITTAYLYSSVVVFGLRGKIFFWELATLIDIMLFGHWIEMKSVMGASRALEELAELMPSAAHKITPDEVIEDIPLQELKTGDVVIIKPGEKVPADGIVIEGESSVNESMLTGESKPVYKSKGDVVIGGSINGEGSLKVEVKKPEKIHFYPR